MALIKIAQHDLSLGQNGFTMLSGSGYISASNANESWYWLKTIVSSELAARSSDGSHYVATSSRQFLTASVGITITTPANCDIFGPFTAVSMSSGIVLAYKSGF